MVKVNHRNLTLTLAIALVAAFLIGLPTPSNTQTGKPARAIPKYIFLFLSDGAGLAHMEITRQYNRLVLEEGLTIADKIMTEGTVGLMTTHAANSLSTDSAAAATSLASGCKANIGALGICADGSVPATAMEVAERHGMRLGIVTNATVYDASPAAFLCHVPNRREYAAIVQRYFDLQPNVLLGGGREYFLPKGQPGSVRDDDKDMVEAFTKKGYRYVTTKTELEPLSRGKVLGLFSKRDMSLEIDRDKNTEPSVRDMTKAAIRLLHDQNLNGFFAFIESENVDTASHLSDLASVVHDYREFDRAVALAYEFYRAHPRETLIIVTSDHETGGLGATMALKDLTSRKGSNQAAATENELRKLQSVKISLQKASKLLGKNPTGELIDNLMQQHFAGFVLAPEYREAILHRQPPSRTMYLDPVANTLGMMVANNTQIYWQTSSHTNHPVLVAALGVGAERFKGYYDNADFGKKLHAILSGNDKS